MEAGQTPLAYDDLVRLARGLEPEVRASLNALLHPEMLPKPAVDLWIAAWLWAVAPV